MQKCVVRHPSWWAGHLPTTVSAGEQDHGGWDSKPSLEAATESCPPQGAQGRCEPQSSPWSLGTGITHRGLEASPGPSRPPPPQTQSEKGLGEGRGRQVPSEELCSIPSSSPDDSVRNIFCKSCRARYPTQVFLKRVQDGLFQTLSLGSLSPSLEIWHYSMFLNPVEAV